MASYVWYGQGAGSRALRALLWPAELLFGVISRRVGVQKARGAVHGAVPTISVGNLTVGGTGKTPVAAWFAAQLKARGFKPVLLLRGYGDDEPKVHELLNPDVPVLVDAERRRSGKRALAQGATALVMDDAFQHRQMPRDVDVVLLSADAWDGRVRLLPAGPFREELSALRRAHLVVVTRKAATRAQADEVARAVRDICERVPIAIVHLAPASLVPWGGGAATPAATLRGERVLAVSGIGAPGAFAAQLRALGADVQDTTFGDHHAYSDADVAMVVARASGVERVVCTLKDAVKLGPRWPHNAPGLWYLSQAVVWESGQEGVQVLLDRLIQPQAALITPAPAGPKTESNG
jgi:tetraacyldisaccharide 4'-kinase